MAGTAVGKRGSYATGRERRDRILDVAAERFAADGYSKTSLAEIAREVGITTPGLTHHFPTKQHLLLAIADRRNEIAVAAALQRGPDADGLRALRLMVELAEMFAAHPAITQLAVLVTSEAADTSSTAHALYRQRYERVIRDLTRDFRDGVELGALRPDLDYEQIARECVAVSDGIQLQWVLSGGAVDYLGMIRRHLERLAPTITLAGTPVSL